MCPAGRTRCETVGILASCLPAMGKLAHEISESALSRHGRA